MEDTYSQNTLHMCLTLSRNKQKYIKKEELNDVQCLRFSLPNWEEQSFLLSTKGILSFRITG